MKYIETKIFTTSQGTEPVMALLLSYGIENISVDDPRDVRELIIKKDNKEWDYIDTSLIKGEDEAIVIFYIENTESGKNLLNEIKIEVMKLKSDEMYGNYGENVDFGRMYMESNPLSDDWKNKWKEGIHPFKITENIVIKPTWEEYIKKDDEIIIEIDPGMAFGTGSHETTGSCAILLEKYIKKDDDVLDIGTGSGILAIIASLRGAKNVDAYDIDSTAIEVAKANLNVNKISAGVNVAEKDILKTELAKAYDIIVSNLTSRIIKSMIPTVAKALKGNGKVILSGMLKEEKVKMQKFFADSGLSILDEITDGDWYTVLLEKQR